MEVVVRVGSESPAYGGDGGTEFSDGLSNGILKVRIRSGSWIDAISCTHNPVGVPRVTPQHGGNGGTANPDMKLDYPNEYIYRVTGTYGDYVHSLTFYTKNSTTGDVNTHVYGNAFGNSFDTGDDTTKVVVGFYGRSGDYLDKLGVYYKTN